ncbi:MAG: FAD-dependent oxidoreductase [Caulobacteraceae bacterium]
MAELGGKRIQVAGAGALGLACAFALARAGALVTVADPAPFASNASGVAAGMMSPALECMLDKASAGHFQLLEAAKAEWADFAQAADISIDTAGALYVGQPFAAAKALVEMGAPFEMMADQDLSERQPALASGLPGLYLPGEWRIDAGVALWALRAACEALGVRFLHRHAIPGDADLLVAATGFAHGLAPELACLSPIKGHILRYPDVVLSGPIVRADGAYISAGADGARVGATMEPGRTDGEIDPEAVVRLAAYAEVLMPGLTGHRMIAATGIRATTPDGLPLVGWSSEPNILVAAGARRNGWLLAPMIAARITALAAGREPDPRTAAFDSGRFR